MQRPRLTLLAVSLATFMTYLDNNIVNVAMPTIQHDLNLSTSGLEWVVSAYILVFASLLLAGGRLADVVGRRRVFLIGLTIFTGASLVAGLAGDVATLITSRAVQGLGAAMLTPTTLAIISATFTDKRKRAAAVGVATGVGALALAVGPLIGGFLSQHVSWGWIFFLNVPVGIVTGALAVFAIRESSAEDAPRRLDIPGIVTSTGALSALTYGLIEGHSLGWSSPAILTAFAVAVVLAVGFLSVERRAAQPMIKLSLFADRVFSGGIIALMMWAFGLFGIYFYTAIYLQQVLGFSATEAGAAFVPMALLMVVGAIASEQISHRVGAHRLVSFAIVLMGLGIASVALLGDHAGYGALMPSFIAIGIGGGLSTPLTASVLEAMPRAEAGVASAVFNASREVAGLLGITVIGVVLTARQTALSGSGSAPLDAYLGGYKLGLLVAGALVVVGGITAYFGLRNRAVVAVDQDDDAVLVAV